MFPHVRTCVYLVFNLCLSCVFKTYGHGYTFSIKRYNLFKPCRCFDIKRHIKDTKRPYLAISDIIHHIPTSSDTIRQTSTCKRLHFSNFVSAITFDTFRHFSDWCKCKRLQFVYFYYT